MKRTAALLLAGILLLSGCATQPAEQKDPLADWFINARLDAKETPDELYAAALDEDILSCSAKGIETKVNLGEKIGIAM